MIFLRDIWKIKNVKDYKVHFARYNGTTHPLDDWVSNPQIWDRWQESRPKRAGFNRRFIFSLMQFYHETDIWLFGGVFKVCADQGDRYVVKLAEQGQNFIGRLKLHSSYRSRTPRVNFENYYDVEQNEQLLFRDIELREQSPNYDPIFKVQEILRERYSGRSFPGYENIDLSFAELDTLIRNDRPDWKVALASVKGVYLISDKNTDKRYVGVAYGDMGIWQRWHNYVDTGHGGNVELQELVRGNGIEYCRKYFQFALLEYRPAYTSDDVVRKREQWWKNVLGTRESGLNRN